MAIESQQAGDGDDDDYNDIDDEEEDNVDDDDDLDAEMCGMAVESQQQAGPKALKILSTTGQGTVAPLCLGNSQGKQCSVSALNVGTRHQACAGETCVHHALKPAW